MEEAQEGVASDEVHFAGFQRLRRRLAGSAGDRRIQAQDVARSGDSQDDAPAFAAPDGKLDATFTYHKDSWRRLPLQEEHRSLRIRH